MAAIGEQGELAARAVVRVRTAMSARGLTRLIPALAGLALLSACVATQELHGFAPSRSEVEQIQPGVDTITSIETNIGRPSSTGLIGDRSWFYVSTTIENLTYNPPRVVDRTVVAIEFDEDGVVEAVNTFGLEDGRIINLNTNITVTSGRTLGFLEQLFGSFGRFTTENVVN